jgi:acetyl esterase
LLAQSHKDLPPALIITAGCDILRDEGRNYAAALIAEGIEVNFIEYPGVLHGFFGLTGMIDEADAANIAAGRSLIAAFSK